jgi:ADP-heptose:LPS heptosyltransferase
MIFNNATKVNYEFNAVSVLVKVFFKKTTNKHKRIVIKNFYTNTVLYDQEVGEIDKSFVENNIYFYFTIYNTERKFKLTIFEENIVIYDENILITSKYGVTIPQPTVLLFFKYLGLGDCLWANPTIKKLYNSFERKIDVITKYPQLLVNNPYVNNVYTVDPNVTDINHVYDDFKVRENPNFYEIFPFHKNECTHISQLGFPNYINKWGVIDLREMAAINCGFNLLPNERQIEFFPEEFSHIDLPDKYVLINPRIAGVDRDLGREKWQKLIDILNENNVNVVTIGVNNKNDQPEYHDVNVKLGVNLCGLDCQSNLSQTWHIMNKSKCFVTFDTGMYILSGTTDTQIFLIGWYAEPHWHKPFRQGSYDHKLNVINGTCMEKCLSNLKYYVNEHTSLSQIAVQKCALNYPEFKCIPSVEKIAMEVIEYYKNS